MTAAEFERSINSATRSLSGEFETSGDVLTAMQANDLYRRPDDYYATVASRYRALTLPQATRALKGAIDPAKLVWVVVGDAAKVKPQLDSLGLPVEVMPASAVAGGSAAPAAAAAPTAAK